MNVSATSVSSYTDTAANDGGIFLSTPVVALLVTAAALGFVVGAAVGLRKSSRRRVAPLPGPEALAQHSSDRSAEVVAARATPAAAVFGRSDVAVFSLSPLATPAFAEGPGAGCAASRGLGTIGEEAVSLSSDA